MRLAVLRGDAYRIVGDRPMGFKDFVSNSINYMMTMSITDIIDVLIVAGLIYACIGLIRRTNAIRLARGIVLILLALVISDLLNLQWWVLF